MLDEPTLQILSEELYKYTGGVPGLLIITLEKLVTQNNPIPNTRDGIINLLEKMYNNLNSLLSGQFHFPYHQWENDLSQMLIAAFLQIKLPLKIKINGKNLVNLLEMHGFFISDDVSIFLF